MNLTQFDAVALAQFIHTCNQGEQKCGYVGSTPEDIAHDLSGGLLDTSFVVYEGENIIASVTIDMYEVSEDGQMDIEVWGPFVNPRHEDRLSELLNYVKTTTEQENIRHIHFFVSGNHEPLISCLGRFDNKKVRDHYFYTIPMSQVVISSTSAEEFTMIKLTNPEDAYVKPLIELHYDYFKTPIFTNEDIVEEIGRAEESEYDLEAIVRESQFIGYLITRRNELTGIINLEYVCIAPEERSKGIGNGIIQYLVNKYKGTSYTILELVVDGENAGAISFYEKNGFHLNSLMKHIVIDAAALKVAN